MTSRIGNYSGLQGGYVTSFLFRTSFRATFKTKGVWDGVVERVQWCLAGWKRQYLSKGGRIMLIKSVLSSIPTYFMSLHVIPVTFARWLEKLQWDFLWGSGREGFHYHLVVSDRICTPREGGLGCSEVGGV